MVNDLINSAVSKIRDTATRILGAQAVKTINQVGGELAQSAKTIGSIGAGYLSGYVPFLPNLPTQAKQQARDYLKQRGTVAAGVDVLRGVGAVTNPIGYAAYRSFPAVYGAIGPKKQGESALDAALRGIQEYAGPSRAFGIEGTKAGKILDTGEMIAGLALNKGIDDLAIKGIRKTGAKIGLKLGAYGGDPYVTDFTTVNNARQRLALLWPKRGGYLTNDDLDFLTQAEKNAEIYRDAFKLMSHQEWGKLDLVRKYDMISEKLENMVRSGQQPIMGIVDPAMSKNVNPSASSEVTQSTKGVEGEGVRVDVNKAKNLISKAYDKDLPNKDPFYVQSLVRDLRDMESSIIRNGGFDNASLSKQGFAQKNISDAINHVDKVRSLSPSKGVGGEGILPKELENAVRRSKFNVLSKEDFVKQFEATPNENVESFMKSSGLDAPSFYDKYLSSDISKIRELEDTMAVFRRTGADMNNPEVYSKIYNEWKDLKYQSLSPSKGVGGEGVKTGMDKIVQYTEKGKEGKFWTINDGGVIKEVEGRPIKLVNGVETFIHQGDNPKRYNKGFVVSEKSTGRYLAVGETAREAIVNAKKVINDVGEDKFRQTISRLQLSSSKVPRANQVVNPRAASEATQAKIKAKSVQMTPDQGFQSASSLPPTKQRKFIKTVLESRQAADDLKEAVAKVPQTYNPISNVETLAKAEKAVDANPEAVFIKVTGDTLPKDEPYTDLIAQGEALMSRLQKEGKFDEAAQVAESLARKGTELGQSVQAFSIWSRLTPEGMLRYAAKEIKQANESRGFLDRLFKTRNAVLTPELAQSITAKMTQVQQMPAGAARDKLVREVLQEISENIPPGVSELFDAYRYQNLLSSPRTQLRNIYGNLFQSFVTRPATMVFDGGIDFVRSALTGTERRAYLSDVPTYYKGVLNSFPNAINAFAESWKGLSAVKQPDIQGLRTAAMPGSLTFITRFMEGMDKFQQAMLGSGEMAVQLKKGKTLEEAMEIATQQAEKYLFRSALDPSNKTGQGHVLALMDQWTQGIMQAGQKIKPLRWFIPFVRTPMNVAKQWIEYSPAGVLTVAGAANKQQQVAKAMLGSTIVGLGGMAAFNNQTTWAAPTDQKEKELFYASGKKPFSVKIGDKWVPMIYFGPFAFPLGIAAAYKHNQMDSRTALTDNQIEKGVKTLSGIVELFSGQTFAQGLGDFVRLVQGDADYTVAGSLSSAASQVIPFSSFFRYVNTIVDPVFRKTSGTGISEQFINRLKTTIPGFSQSLPAYTEPTGEPSKRNITDYVAPFTMGIEKPQYNQLLDLRRQELQQNALESRAKKEAERALESKDLPAGGKAQDALAIYFGVDSIAAMPTTTEYQRMKQQAEAFKKLDKIMESSLSDDQKSLLLGQMGITPQQAEYYGIASQSDRLKYAYVQDQMQQIAGRGGSHEALLEYLVSNRQEVNGRQLVSNGVLDDLYNDGFITYQERKDIKNIATGSDGRLRVKQSSGSRAKIKKVTLPKLKKAKAAKVSAIKVKKSKVQPLKFKPIKAAKIRLKTKKRNR